MTYYPIDEATARHAWYNVHMGEYREGSETAQYRSAVDEAAALVAQKKECVSPFYHAKLDALLDSYARRLAAWQNAYNRNTASCPSVLVAGFSNFPTGKKARQNAREDTLWREYEQITGILDRIRATGTGPVDLTDPHARELLTDQLQRAQAALDRAKSINAYFRKHHTFDGCPDLDPETAARLSADLSDPRSLRAIHGKPFPDYELTSLRGKIQRLQARLADLDKLQAAADHDDAPEDFPGGRIVRNADLNRLQIFFDAVPDPDTRARLKSSGFRWAPSAGAWQRQLTDNAIRDARAVLGL